LSDSAADEHGDPHCDDYADAAAVDTNSHAATLR
jgi:hypothetical protein